MERVRSFVEESMKRVAWLAGLGLAACDAAPKEAEMPKRSAIETATFALG
jgi:hypothetical protein